ncbi:cytochrome P450 [Aliidongia dinghuensis]|uniref:Cytochrome P450 n=1 Tax=Aliidongia dinghuensis TaxID=1867774 RepID=A0A8J2YTY3_9PROT|nr:cytochrome P450 [Aliidongia dinghuensis]GGF15915.1 cytochrome P450 [Aliidongia dinghuensis]
MSGVVDAASFGLDPLAYLDTLFPTANNVAWLPRRQLCIADAGLGRDILGNKQGLYRESADFFDTKAGTFGPRAAQIQVGSKARSLLKAHLKSIPSTRELLESVAAPRSLWPDAGNELVYRLMAGMIAGPARSERFRGIVRAIVDRAVLAGAKGRHSKLGRAWFRYRLLRAFERERTEARDRAADEAQDIFDVVVTSAPAATPTAQLLEVFVSFVFAIVGSVGFALGWSVYLLGRHGEQGTPPAWIVSEALRLFPIAWMLAKRPAHAHRLAGVAVTPEDWVVVSPYAIHRNPQYWTDPNRFLPERWAANQDWFAWLPFGAGPHGCVATALTLQIVDAFLAPLMADFRFAVHATGDRPFIGAALAPPPFALELSPR